MSGQRSTRGWPIHQRSSDGRYYAIVELEPTGGKRNRRYVYGRTKDEVGRKLLDVLGKSRRGQPLPPERLTVGQYLDSWLTDSVSRRLRPATLASYRALVRGHLIPGLGHLRLARLRPEDVDALLARKVRSLAPSTTRQLKTVLSIALKRAAKRGLVVQNAAALADPVSVPRRPSAALDCVTARRLIAAVSDDPLGALFVVQLALGLRVGEATGLSWDDVDIARGVVRAHHQLQRYAGGWHRDPMKTDAGRRELALPGLVADVLRRHRVRQIEDQLLAGGRWRGNDWNLVFTSPRGEPLHRRSVWRRFVTLLERAELPRMRPHDLRHSYATILFAEALDPKLIQDALGHSDISVTMDTYTHVLDEGKRRVADAIDRALGGLSPTASDGC